MLIDFARVYILNVVVLQEDTIYYLTFLEEGWPMIAKDLSEIDSLDDIFPEKTINLHHHPVKLIQMQIPPYSLMLKGKRNRYYLDGTDRYLLHLILQKLNATYILKYARNFKEVLTSYHDGSADFCLNKISPFWDEAFGKHDFLTTLEMDSFRLMVRSLRQNDVAKQSFLTKLTWLNIFTVLLASLLYSLIFKDQRKKIVMNFFFFIQMLLQMPTAMVFSRQSARMFIAAVLIFCLIQSVDITTSITSKMVNYLPDSGIHTTEDILKANISIYGNSYSVSVIRTRSFDLEAQFVRRMKAVDLFPWNLNTTDDFAYMANSIVFEKFIEVATYNDRHDRQRFYLFPKEIAKFPVNFIFPKNSPLTSTVQGLYLRTQEAGLMERWSLVKLNLMKDWSFFKPSRYAGFKAEEHLNIFFLFKYMVLGHIFSTVVLLAEVLIARWQRKKKYRQCRRSRVIIVPYCN